MNQDIRYARHYVLLDPSDCDPPHSLDLEPGSRDSIKVEALTVEFVYDGFDPEQPALIGYPKNGRIQLLSGTHRHEAAKRAGIKLPVMLKLRSVVEAAWGTDAWEELIKDIPVQELEKYPIQEGIIPPGLDERVDLEKDIEYDFDRKPCNGVKDASNS